MSEGKKKKREKKNYFYRNLTKPRVEGNIHLNYSIFAYFSQSLCKWKSNNFQICLTI